MRGSSREFLRASLHIEWQNTPPLVCFRRRIPEVLFQMNWVSDLCLDNNSIITLPPEIKTMRSLTKLSLRGNHLETLPKELRRCGDLECLLLERNKLTNLPSFVYTMLPLRVLALANNMLDSECIPDDLPLNAGSKLQALVLDSNNIGKLSGAVGLFSSLNVLSFSFNTVNYFPPHTHSFHPRPILHALTLTFNSESFPHHFCRDAPLPRAALSLTLSIERNRLRACQMRSRRTSSSPTCSSTEIRYSKVSPCKSLFPDADSRSPKM